MTVSKLETDLHWRKMRVYGIERERAVADVGRFIDAPAEQNLLAGGSA
jgi:hypothetical protein